MLMSFQLNSASGFERYNVLLGHRNVHSVPVAASWGADVRGCSCACRRKTTRLGTCSETDTGDLRQ